MSRLNHYYCFLSVCVLLASMPAIAQQQSFIHIQTENNQFYELQVNARTYTSSKTGYLVVPQVPAGNYNLVIRFPGEMVTEYTFTVEIGDKPRGFSLRQSIDNGWSLFDMVDFSLFKGELVQPVAKTVISTKPQETLPAPVAETKNSDRPVVKPADPVLVKKEPVPVTKEKINIKPTNVLKIFDKSSSSGIDQVYVLTNGTRLDTIALFIPALIDEQPKSGTHPSAFILQREERDPKKSMEVYNQLLFLPRHPLFSK